MMYFESKIPLTKDNIQSPNLTGKLSERDINTLSTHVWEGYDKDEQSRDKWRRRTEAAMDLAMQISKDKNFPWPGSANVAFPLVTIATLQFHSRAYPAIVPGRDLVRYRVNGDDPDGKQFARANRVGNHMSYQLLEESTTWEEQHDRLLINIPVVGCAFKKTYYAGNKGHNASELVLARDLVMDYFAKSVEDCSRKTHIIPMNRNSIYEGVRSGIYRDILEEAWYKAPARPLEDKSTIKSDNRTGIVPPQSDDDTPFTFLEQHLDIDLDGDGYKEPYVATIEHSSKSLVRLVCRFDKTDAIKRNSRNQIISIKPTEYFTKYGFIPSPDGGIYDIGFGTLLGPLNESVNSILNQLIDAGTMSNTAGGFLGRGAKIRGGVYTFSPLEWKRVDSTGDDLHKSIFPLPVREPSNVLFQLLNLLITYTNRVSGSTETMMGENPGQNTPAQTTQTMVEQGMKIYNAIFKRVWRSMKEEFKKLYILNHTFMPDFVAFGEQGQKVMREDYSGPSERITPVADPNVTSEQQRMQQAMMLKQNAATTPGYNLQLVEQNFLRTMHIDGWEAMYPGPDKVPPLPNVKMQVEQMKLQAKQMALKQAEQEFIINLMEQRRLNSAKILQLEAQAAKLVAEAGGIQTGHQIAMFEASLGALKHHDEALRSRIELMVKAMESDRNAAIEQDANRARMGRLEGPSGDTGAS